jgi:hypothetical protein
MKIKENSDLFTESQPAETMEKSKMDAALFIKFWSVYPRRKGSNPRHNAELKFALALKNKADPQHIISSARRYAQELQEQGKLNTEYVCMAQTWLYQRRWLDYAMDATAEEEKAKGMDTFMASKGYSWNGERWVNGQSV